MSVNKSFSMAHVRKWIHRIDTFCGLICKNTITKFGDMVYGVVYMQLEGSVNFKEDEFVDIHNEIPR